MGGVFAPNSPLRRKVVLKPDSKKGIHFKRGISADSNASGPSQKSLWARLLSQVFKIDVTECDGCVGTCVTLVKTTIPRRIDLLMTRASCGTGAWGLLA